MDSLLLHAGEQGILFSVSGVFKYRFQNGLHPGYGYASSLYRGADKDHDYIPPSHRQTTLNSSNFVQSCETPFLHLS